MATSICDKKKLDKIPKLEKRIEKLEQQLKALQERMDADWSARNAGYTGYD